MPADITLGDNYQIDENSNGNLVIIDSSGNPVLEHTDGGGWSINTTADINDLTDSASGNTVYDASTETFGDGNQTGNFNSINTGQLSSNITDFSSVTGSRSFGTAYQNNSGALRLVEIEVTTSAGQRLNTALSVSNTNSFGSEDRTDQALLPDLGDNVVQTLNGLVPDGGYYLAESFRDASIQNWTERDFKQ